MSDSKKFYTSSRSIGHEFTHPHQGTFTMMILNTDTKTAHELYHEQLDKVVKYTSFHLD